ncbi:serine hydrolase domain-containing protein [Bacillus yapensis]|nr:serine hydrolase [Bacillus yapensis]
MNLALPFEYVKTTKLGMNANKVEEFDEYCQKEESDEFLIISNRKMYYKNYSSTTEAIHLNSLTKVFAGIAIGLLLDEGQIESLHVSIAEYFPTLKNTEKENVTIWHILTHTSGIKTLGHDAELGTAEDCIEYVLARELENSPGTVSTYNNEAVTLLAGIVKKVSGEELDTYLSTRLFKPLNITNWSWAKDKKGTSYAYYGLSLTAIDLAKIGQLFIDKGLWNGKRVLSEKWIEESTHSTQNIEPNWGYLWFTVQNRQEQYIGFGMSGSDGKFLLVCPNQQFIAIRLVHRKKEGPTPYAEHFFKYAMDLVADKE